MKKDRPVVSGLRFRNLTGGETRLTLTARNRRAVVLNKRDRIGQ